MSTYVYLVYGDKPGTVRAACKKPEGVAIVAYASARAAEWTFEESRYTVGVQRQRVCRSGIIGVFDSSNIEHLNNMLVAHHKAIEVDQPDCPAAHVAIVKQEIRNHGAEAWRVRPRVSLF